MLKRTTALIGAFLALALASGCVTDSKTQRLNECLSDLSQRDMEYGLVKQEANMCRQNQQLRQEIQRDREDREERDFRRWQELEGRRPHRPSSAPAPAPAQPRPAVLYQGA